MPAEEGEGAARRDDHDEAGGDSDGGEAAVHGACRRQREMHLRIEETGERFDGQHLGQGHGFAHHQSLRRSPRTQEGWRVAVVVVVGLEVTYLKAVYVSEVFYPERGLVWKRALFSGGTDGHAHRLICSTHFATRHHLLQNHDDRGKSSWNAYTHMFRPARRHARHARRLACLRSVGIECSR